MSGRDKWILKNSAIKLNVEMNHLKLFFVCVVFDRLVEKEKIELSIPPSFFFWFQNDFLLCKRHTEDIEIPPSTFQSAHFSFIDPLSYSVTYRWSNVTNIVKHFNTPYSAFPTEYGKWQNVMLQYTVVFTEFIYVGISQFLYSHF